MSAWSTHPPSPCSRQLPPARTQAPTTCFLHRSLRRGSASRTARPRAEHDTALARLHGSAADVLVGARAPQVPLKRMTCAASPGQTHTRSFHHRRKCQQSRAAPRSPRSSPCSLGGLAPAAMRLKGTCRRSQPAGRAAAAASPLVALPPPIIVVASPRGRRRHPPLARRGTAARTRPAVAGRPPTLDPRRRARVAAAAPAGPEHHVAHRHDDTPTIGARAAQLDREVEQRGLVAPDPDGPTVARGLDAVQLHALPVHAQAVALAEAERCRSIRPSARRCRHSPRPAPGRRRVLACFVSDSALGPST